MWCPTKSLVSQFQKDIASPASRSAILWMLATANIRLVVLALNLILTVAPNVKGRITLQQMENAGLGRVCHGNVHQC